MNFLHLIVAKVVDLTHHSRKKKGWVGIFPIHTKNTTELGGQQGLLYVGIRVRKLTTLKGGVLFLSAINDHEFMVHFLAASNRFVSRRLHKVPDMLSTIREANAVSVICEVRLSVVTDLRVTRSDDVDCIAF